MASPPPPKRNRTYAATSKPPSASASSNVDEFFKLAIVGCHCTSPTIETIAEVKSYNLADITGSEQKSLRGESDSVCLDYMKQIFPEPMYKCVKGEVKEFKDLPPLVCSTTQVPDVCVYYNNILVLQVKVHSSSFSSTIKKCIIGLVDQLRLYRVTNPDIRSCIGFCFPKLPSTSPGVNKQSVVQMKVTWEGFMFTYQLESLPGNVEAALTMAVKTNASKIHKLQSPSAFVPSDFVVRLSTSDLENFGVEAIQVPSKSAILVHTPTQYYKLPIPVNPDTVDFTLVRLQHVITLRRELIGSFRFFVSSKQPYDPMTRGEAKDCLHDLVKQVALAIQELHKSSWAHQDIRLENICFTDKYEPILMDLDRLCVVTAFAPRRYNSCMYPRSFHAAAIDWVQLGWLVAWAYCPIQPNDDYHKRRVDCLPQDCQNDKFLMGLIREGVYKEEDLESSILSATAHQSIIEAVLKKRLMDSS